MTLTKLNLTNIKKITDDGLYYIAFFLKNPHEFSWQYSPPKKIWLRPGQEHTHYVSFYSLFHLSYHYPLLQRIAFSDISLSCQQNGEKSDYYWAPNLKNVSLFLCPNVSNKHYAEIAL